jgi:hypothetical protein
MIEYPMPGSPPDLFKGFREELGKIETKRAQEQAKAEAKEKEDQQRVVQMAARIEQADKSTMFGSDYSIASQWAQHLTDNLDTYASTTEGLVKFQQQAAQLNSFIDASEAYKKENFGSSKDNAQAGTFMGHTQRDALGKNVYGDLIDKRDKQSYEMAFMGLQQPIQVQWGEDDTMMIVKDGKAVSFAEYMRPENPFMPQLEEGKITLGSTWYAEKAANRAHKTRDQAKQHTLNVLKTNPDLQRQAARYYQMRQQEQNKTLTVEEILADPEHLAFAMDDWANDAVTSWVNPNQKVRTGSGKQPKTPSQSFGSIVSGEFEASGMPQSITQSGQGQSGLSAGFDRFYELDKPIKNMRALGEDSEILGFNVDALGQMWIQVQRPAAGEVDPVTGMVTEGEGYDYETMLVQPGTSLFNTIEKRMDEATDGNWMAIQQSLFAKSQQNAQEVPFSPPSSTPPQEQERTPGYMERGIRWARSLFPF